MKKIMLFVLAVCTAVPKLYAADQNAQPSAKKPIVEYTTTIYTDKTIADELVMDEDDTRGFGAGLLASLGNAAVGLATGYISSVVDLGIQAIGKLIVLDRQHKQEWQETVAKECSVTTEIGTLYNLNDFYATGSNNGALDPTGIQFNGIGCLAKTNEDTAYYVSCHLNRQKLHRVRDHSKFELLLDTLIINPYCAHLPNTNLPLRFSFSEHKTFNFKMRIQLISSWMDFTPSLHTDEVLGEFILNVPIDSTDVNEHGQFIYVRQAGEPSRYDLIGDSFIVPRSYMQTRNGDGSVSDHYGTGQYSLKITIDETCDITDAYRKNWREDRKFRKELTKAQRRHPSFDDVCRTITRQTWDETLQSWVVTILKAPADYSIKALSEQMRMPAQQQQPKQ